MKRIIVCFLSLLSLSCQNTPEYRMHYRYQTPTSVSGSTCLSKCVESRSQCDLIEYKACEQRNSDKVKQFEACVEKMQLMDKKEVQNYHINCSMPFRTNSCPVKSDQCLEHYNSCFQSCGGKVDEKKVCVTNCK